MKQSLTLLLLCTVVLIFAPQGALCFGAGEVHPDIAGRAFLHGDLAKVISQINMASFAFKLAEGDIAAIYFGNWLRDYSQAMDTMGLTKVGKDALLIIVQALSFMAFGFATREFRLTEEKLGVYSHAEHIDNPRGYEWKEAQNTHPLLRGEVFNEELDVDLTTGMKNYIAHEGQGYNTSARYVRNTLRECIARGRSANNMKTDNNDKYAALRLLGAALHTLEDFLAHSNWCEVFLLKQGKKEVFCYVGDKTWIDTPDKKSKVPPLVTGTFSGNDFTISVFGTVEDKLCAHGSNDLQQKIKASTTVLNPIVGLKVLLDTAGRFSPRMKELGQSLEKISKDAEKMKEQLLSGNSSKPPAAPVLPTEESRKRERDEREKFSKLEASDKARTFQPLGEDKRPDNAMGVIWDVLNVRDELMRELEELVKEYPAMKKMYKLFHRTVNKVVWSILAQLVSPSIDALTEASNDSHKQLFYLTDQQEVFDRPESSNPTHSWLAKDHFNNALHVPSAKVAEVVVKHTVERVLRAWNDSNYDAEAAIDEIMQTFHHPCFMNPKSTLQTDMQTSMNSSIADLEKDNLIGTLTKENVRAKKNVRLVPETKTTLDKLGDIFGELTKEGPDLVHQLAEELGKAREEAAKLKQRIANGEGEKVIAEFADKTQKALDQLAQDVKRDALEVKNDVVKKAEEFGREADRKIENITNAGKRKAEEIAGDYDRMKKKFKSWF